MWKSKRKEKLKKKKDLFIYRTNWGWQNYITAVTTEHLCCYKKISAACMTVLAPFFSTLFLCLFLSISIYFAVFLSFSLFLFPSASMIHNDYNFISTTHSRPRAQHLCCKITSQSRKWINFACLSRRLYVLFRQQQCVTVGYLQWWGCNVFFFLTLYMH